MVAQEHHGFQPAFVGDIHHFLAESGHFPALEGLEILVFLGGNPILVVVIALIHNKFGAELIADLLLKLLQDTGGHRGGIAVPVHELLPPQLVEHQRELVEEGGVADDVHIGVLLNEFPQPLHGEFMGFRLAHVKGDLVLEILPVVRHRVVHMHRIPDDVGQERHGIVMIRRRFRDHHAAGIPVIVPGIRA